MRNEQKVQTQAELVIQLIGTKRKNKPRTGTRKLHIELRDEFREHGIKAGRDKLFDIMREHRLLIKKRKTKVRTTQSYHWLRKYPNLIRGFEPLKANELWVSDITYIKTDAGFVYLYLITDAYSRKILGWNLSYTLHASNAVKALKDAVVAENPKQGLIHHSDRGVQYCSSDYVNVLNTSNARISMTENGDPRENAIAERVNGILKDEWINDLYFADIEEATKAISKIIHTYNTERLHQSLSYQTPEDAHRQSGKQEKRWKNYYKPQSPSLCFQ